MTRGLLGAVCLVGVGCTNLNYQKLRDIPPPPAVTAETGTEFRITDARPGWEKKPFQDAISLHAIGGVTPAFWEQLRGTLFTTVGELSEPPGRVEVVIRSVQIVGKDSARVEREAAGRKVIHPEPAADVSLGDVAGNLLFGPLIEMAVNAPWQKRYPAALEKSPDGISCTIKAEVHVNWVGGRSRVVPVFVIATTANTSGTRYAGDAIDEAVRLVMTQFATHLRRGLGLPGQPDETPSPGGRP